MEKVDKIADADENDDNADKPWEDRGLLADICWHKDKMTQLENVSLMYPAVCMPSATSLHDDWLRPKLDESLAQRLEG